MQGCVWLLSLDGACLPGLKAALQKGALRIEERQLSQVHSLSLDRTFPGCWKMTGLLLAEKARIY